MKFFLHYHSAQYSDLSNQFKNSKVTFIQCDLTKDIELEDYFGHIARLSNLYQWDSIIWHVTRYE